MGGGRGRSDAAANANVIRGREGVGSKWDRENAMRCGARWRHVDTEWARWPFLVGSSSLVAADADVVVVVVVVVAVDVHVFVIDVDSVVSVAVFVICRSFCSCCGCCCCGCCCCSHQGRQLQTPRDFHLEICKCGEQ